MGVGKKVLGGLIGTVTCIGAVALCPIAAPLAGTAAVTALITGGAATATTATTAAVGVGGFVAGCASVSAINKAKNKKSTEKELENCSEKSELYYHNKCVYITLSRLFDYIQKNDINPMDYMTEEKFRDLNQIIKTNYTIKDEMFSLNYNKIGSLKDKFKFYYKNNIEYIINAIDRDHGIDSYLREIRITIS